MTLDELEGLVASCDLELDAYNRSVTDWELRRYFERI